MLKEYCSQGQEIPKISKKISAMLGPEKTSKSTSAWVWQGMAYVSKENVFQE